MGGNLELGCSVRGDVLKFIHYCVILYILGKRSEGGRTSQLLLLVVNEQGLEH